MSRTQSEGDSERARETLQPEIRVGVSGSQFFSLFLLLERETGHGCNCCRSPSLSHCPLSPVSLPACLLPLACLSVQSDCVRLFVALLISANHRESHCSSGGFRSIPNDQSLLTPSTHSVPQYQSQFPNNSLPDALSFCFFLSGAICKLPTWGSVSLGLHSAAGSLRPVRI